MVNKKQEEKTIIEIEKVEELDDTTQYIPSDVEEIEKATNDFELKKWGANVWSDIPEVNKDFTMSNLSDQMFNSRVVNFIRNRILLVKLLRNIFRYAERRTEHPQATINIPIEIKQRISYETIAFRKSRNLILSDVYTILNLSKGRGGLVLKAFLKGGMTPEEMETIAGETGPAIGEPIERSTMDRLLGRNRSKTKGKI